MEIGSFNWLDWAIIGIIVLSTLVGVIRGFVREGLSLVVWGLAFWAAFAFSNSLAPHFSGHINNSSIRYGIAFAVLFLGTLIVGGLINYLISHAVRKTGLGGTDRFLGLFFGCARGILVVALVMLLAGLTPVNKQKFWQDSKITPHFSWVVTWIQSILPKSIQQHLQMTLDKTQMLSPDVTVNAQDINAPALPPAAQPAPANADPSKVTPGASNDSSSLDNADSTIQASDDNQDINAPNMAQADADKAAVAQDPDNQTTN